MERDGGGGVGRSSTAGSSRGSSSCHHHRQQQQQQPPWRRRRSHDVIHSFSWPRRSYSCSFCKREFRSAQALGGHMNVHRRDRAMLRNYSPPPPWDPPNPNPNPNPNPSRAPIPNLNSSPPPTPKPVATSLDHPCLGCDDLPTSASVWDRGFEGIVMKNNVIMATIGGRVEEDLDLELRLGYA